MKQSCATIRAPRAGESADEIGSSGLFCGDLGAGALDGQNVQIFQQLGRSGYEAPVPRVKQSPWIRADDKRHVVSTERCRLFTELPQQRGTAESRRSD